MKITASNNGVWEEFIYCTEDRCFQIVLHSFGDQKEHQFFGTVNKKCVVSFLFARGASRTFHAVCFRDLRISYTGERGGAVG
jgi:hypothetical protein